MQRKLLFAAIVIALVCSDLLLDVHYLLQGLDSQALLSGVLGVLIIAGFYIAIVRRIQN